MTAVAADPFVGSSVAFVVALLILFVAYEFLSSASTPSAPRGLSGAGTPSR